MMGYWDTETLRPIPKGVLDKFERREVIFDMAQYNSSHWTADVAATGTVTWPAAAAAAFSYPHLLLSVGAVADQAAVKHPVSWIQMPPATPSASQELLQFVLFEGAYLSAVSTSNFVGLGYASGTSDQFLAPATGAPLTSGAGIMWQRVSGAGWRLVYKSAAGSLQTIYTNSTSSFTQNKLIRFGWLLRGAKNGSGSGTCATIFPILQLATVAPDGVVAPDWYSDDRNASGFGAFPPAYRGVQLDATNYGDASETQCALQMAMVGNTAGSRTFGITRVIYADNFRS